MRLIKAATEEEFIMPANFKPKVTRVNAMLTDESEQTAPITLPGDPLNLRLIEHAERIDNYYKPVTDMDILVSDGLMVRPANLGIHSASETDGISSTIYLGTSQFYSLIDEKKLNSLNWPIIKSPDYDNQTLAQRVTYLIGLIKAEYNAPTTDSAYRIAPLLTDKTVKPKRNGVVTEQPFILNEYYPGQYNFGATNEVIINKFYGEYTQQFMENDVLVDIGIGYGITPFLRIKYILEFIFGEYGFTVDFTELNARFIKFESLCIENNIADAIYAGRIKYSQLVPDLTIKDFLTKVSTYFGGKFIVNENSKVAKFRLFSNVLTTSADMDLSDYLSSALRQSSAEFKNLIVKLPDETEPELANDYPKENIDFNIHDELSVIASYTFDIFIHEIEMRFVQTTGVLHLNSSVQVAGKTQEEDVATNSSFDIIQINSDWSEIGQLHNYVLKTIFYRESRNYLTYEFDGIASTLSEKLKYIYAEYSEFLLNSNIQVNSSMMLPETLLERIDLTIPKIFFGQKLMIEELDMVLDGQPTKSIDLILRTTKKYNDR